MKKSNGNGQERGTKKKQPDLPAMKGPGVEVPEIPELEEASERYVEVRDKRMMLTEKEVQARTVLSEVLTQHRGGLPKDEDGNPFYPYEGKRVILLAGRERVKVKMVDDEDEDES